MMKADAVGIYIHIPFCIKKCNYCDFASFSDVSLEIRERYIAALISEIKDYSRDPKINADTVFFGGGTPSLLSPDELSAIMCAIRETFDIDPDSEVTLEMNPKTADLDRLIAYRRIGVNRISIGMQSIHKNELLKLGRIHDFEDFLCAYNAARAAGFDNISVDVMYGIPEQTKESFKETVEKVISLNPQHISVYGLILEENTPFWNTRNSLPLPSEDDECDMYYYAADALKKAGYLHYEISNYALEGYPSRHNLKYWRSCDYIGVGVAAYSCFLGERFGNASSFDEYFSESKRKYYCEKLTDRDREYEYVMLALRLAEGISLSEYRKLFGKDFFGGREEAIDKYLATGNITIDGDRLALTECGFYISNTVLTDLL